MVEELTLHDTVAAAGLLCWVCPKCFSQHSNHSELNILTQTTPQQFLSPSRRVSWIHKTSPGSALFTILPHPLKQVFLRSVMPHLHPQTFRSHSTCGWSVPLCKRVFGLQQIHLDRNSQRRITFCLGLVKNFYPFGVHVLCSMLFPSSKEICASIAVSMETANAVHHVSSFNMEICIS